jgi:PIN domain nuclease of toxin-antitoxin system
MAMARPDRLPLSKDARRLIDRQQDLRISPMILVEIEVLREIGRIKVTSGEVMRALATDLGLRVCDLPFQDVARQAAVEGWTRDPFDRIIVAQARLANGHLITRDAAMQAHYAKALS